jgi:hypothetical protein
VGNVLHEFWKLIIYAASDYIQFSLTDDSDRKNFSADGERFQLISNDADDKTRQTVDQIARNRYR